MDEGLLVELIGADKDLNKELSDLVEEVIEPRLCKAKTKKGKPCKNKPMKGLVILMQGIRYG